MYFDHPNALGSEQQWTNVAGSTGGEVLSDPWGNEMVDTTNGNLYRLFGSMFWYDPSPDGYQTPTRYYIPRHSRWLSPDSVRGDVTNPQTLDLYNYVTDNPTTLNDPSGLCGCGGGFGFGEGEGGGGGGCGGGVAGLADSAADIVRHLLRRTSRFPAR